MTWSIWRIAQNPSSIVEGKILSLDLWNVRICFCIHIVHAILGLLDLADSYCETRLKKQCENMIKKGISIENVASLLAASIKYNAKVRSCLFFRSTVLPLYILPGVRVKREILVGTYGSTQYARASRRRSKLACYSSIAINNNRR